LLFLEIDAKPMANGDVHCGEEEKEKKKKSVYSGRRISRHSLKIRSTTMTAGSGRFFFEKKIFKMEYLKNLG